jgi:hypothetical protein
MKRLRAFLDRLPGGHRPPTGPLTTEESKTEAEAVRKETLNEDNKRLEREPDERDDAPDRDR